MSMQFSGDTIDHSVVASILHCHLSFEWHYSPYFGSPFSELAVQVRCRGDRYQWVAEPVRLYSSSQIGNLDA